MSDAVIRALAVKAFRAGFSAVIRIEPEGGVSFDVDGRRDICAVVDAQPNLAPDCVWRANAETLARIFEGGRALESAYLSGRLSIAGDISVMARLVLENPR